MGLAVEGVVAEGADLDENPDPPLGRTVKLGGICWFALELGLLKLDRWPRAGIPAIFRPSLLDPYRLASGELLAFGAAYCEVRCWGGEENNRGSCGAAC